ncbi:MAG: ABC transporter ATP-binding protein [Chloracidobacterium sp.]|uniref:ABC transporter ATP-binding protein n=1 Tax=Chloracidobacterium validum TaxID=2821543 RepID=A0ABX8BI34_9BACT|nr:ABC transporter ATP-binding protein [Chloracidobacterium validum]QUW04710.1 ABC transporter ATP-binding protein [Chloracidobacterium validum]
MSQPDDEILGKAYDHRLAKRLFAYLKPYWGRVALAIPLIALTAGFELLALNLTMAAVDLFLMPPATERLGFFSRLTASVFEALGGRPSPVDGVSVIGGLYLGLMLVVFGLTYWQTMLLNGTGQFVMYDLRRELFAKFQRLPLSYYDRTPIGRMTTRLTSDVDALNELFTSGFVTLFSDVVVLVGILLFLFLVNWKLALVSLFVVPLLAAVTAWFRVNATRTYREVRTRLARINAFLQEHLSGMATVQLFNREQREFQAFDAINDAHRRINIETIFYYAVFYPAIGFVSNVGVALVIWYGGGQALTGALSLGALIFFIQAMQRFYEPIQDISEKYNILQAAMAAAERVFKVLDEPLVITSPPTPKQPSVKRGEIEFRNVWFAYKGEHWVLRDVSFRVAPGQTVALVGATGAGKTSITSLLMRFYDVQRGQILIDGVDVRDFDLAELRRYFGVVLQDPTLFAGTIADNLRLGATDIDDARLMAAAREVQADAFIRRLPGGYQAEVKERGATLSVGQKQLLALARALAFSPRILILDEATASIDSETEGLIQSAIERVLVGRTCVVIAHRLSTVRKADCIIVMHRGEIREMGTHAELVARPDGIYRRLYALQYQEARPAARTTATGLPATAPLMPGA